MTPHLFWGFGPYPERKIGVVLERIVHWELASSLGSTGTCLHLDNKETVLIGNTPKDVESVISELFNS